MDDVSTLKSAFQGASVIFGNTAFSNVLAMHTEADVAKLKEGQTVRNWCFETEVRQGKNIVDAVASVDNLDLFVWSTLSHASKWSKGKYKGVYHFDSKAVVVDYINNVYPKVAKKTSFLQMGLFVTNWKWGQAAVPWEKVGNKTCENIRRLLINSETGWLDVAQSSREWRCSHSACGSQ